jgi:hypothetical protein
MSVALYQKLQGGHGGFGQALLDWRARYAAELAAEAEAEADGVPWEDPFADVRDRSIDGGRPPIDWGEILGVDPGEGQANAAPSPGAASAAKPKARRLGRSSSHR